MSTTELIVQTIPADSVERLDVVVATSADPTGGAIEWQLTAPGGDPVPDGWVPGAWVIDSWDPLRKRATATSPLVAQLGVADGERYDVWVRWAVDDEEPRRRAGRLRVG